MKIHAATAWLLFFKVFPGKTLCLEQNSAGLLEVKLIFQHIGYKKIMSVGDELWRRKSNRMKRTEVVTSVRHFESSEKESFIHQINKGWSFISCLGYGAFPFSFFFLKLQSIQQPPRSMRQRSCMWLCNEAFWERLKSWNEAQGKW